MSHERIYLSPPHLSNQAKESINQAIDSNWIAPLGPMVNAFEQKLATQLSPDSHWVALNSGTAAIHLALRMLNIGKGDVVLCQSFSCVASAAPVIQLGAKVVFVGSEKETWNLSPRYLEEAIVDLNKRSITPKAIIAVGLYGMPFNVTAIKNIATKYAIPLIEDAAESLGSFYKGAPCGSFGDFSILSFNGNKIITTSGGGALRVQSNKEKQRAIYLGSHAKLEAPYYSHQELGYNYRMSNIIAAIGVSQLQVLPQRVKARRDNHAFYKQFFDTYKGVQVFSEPNTDFVSNHWLTCILLDSEQVKITVAQLILALEVHQIEARRLWKPLHTQEVFKDCEYYGDQTEVSLFDFGLCLPSGSNLSDEQKSRIIKVLENHLL